MRNLLGSSLLFLIPTLALVACGGDDPDPPGGDPGGTGGSAGGCTADCGTGAGGAGGTGGAGGSGAGTPGDILEQIEALEGVEVTELPEALPGYRAFDIVVDQPVDHGDPAGQRFQQRVQLLHRDASAPLVLASTGYLLWGGQYLEEPASLLDANQIYVEHRYFLPSRPEPADWSMLTIEQAAADHHRIVELFKPLYPAAWISTGGSKGGMTSVYHRRFYPDDVDGTVPYVAPQSFGHDDPRYIDFLEQVGDDPACRQALRDFQREVLIRREYVLQRMSQQALDQGFTYDVVGVEPTLESVTIDFAFAFWQYGDASNCSLIPAQGASDEEVWQFFDSVGTPSFSSDEWLLALEPYYYQAYAELGFPGVDKSHLQDLLQIDFSTVDSTPSFPEPAFDAGAMQDIDQWVQTEGERLLFVYGETDPWTAGAFTLGAAEDSYLLVAPGANHGASIGGLNAPDRDAAIAALEAWTGVTISQQRVLGAPRPAAPPPPALRLLRRVIAR